MKRLISGIVTLLVVVLFVTSGLFKGFLNFICWLVTLNMTQSKISLAGEIFVKITTWAVTYSFVGFLFDSLGWFDSDAMKFVYFVVSTMISFALCYVIMLLETYLLYIVIAVAIFAVIVFAVIVGTKIHNKKNISKRLKENTNEPF